MWLYVLQSCFVQAPQLLKLRESLLVLYIDSMLAPSSASCWSADAHAHACKTCMDL